MIHCEYGLVQIICDCCDKKATKLHNYLDEAQAEAKEKGFVTQRRVDGTWVNYCPDCFREIV